MIITLLRNLWHLLPATSHLSKIIVRGLAVESGVRVWFTTSRNYVWFWVVELRELVDRELWGCDNLVNGPIWVGEGLQAKRAMRVLVNFLAQRTQNWIRQIICHKKPTATFLKHSRYFHPIRCQRTPWIDIDSLWHDGQVVGALLRIILQHWPRFADIQQRLLCAHRIIYIHDDVACVLHRIE